MSVRIMVGNACDILATLPSGSVQCAVTSPPYFNLRSYLPDRHPDKALEIGSEPNLDVYIAGLVSVYREMRRVLADDGVFFLNLGDSYSSGKQLRLMPYRAAMALQADGWILRSNICWHKPNPLPESVRDRPTNAHESVFLLTKNARYFYNAAAVAEAAVRAGCAPGGNRKVDDSRNDASRDMSIPVADMRNLRNVWTIAPRSFRGAHFATFPPELAARCIKAGSRPGDTILDPFFGAGTTALAAPDRDCIGIDINAAYADLASARLTAAGLSVTIEQPHQPAAQLEAAE